jgi:thiol-disulfide isomerase/thioredoxin
MSWLPYLLLGALAVPVGLQVWAYLRAIRMRGRAAPDLSGVPGAAADGRHLYYFHSRHCGPCRAVTPAVDRLTERHANVHKIDVGHDPDLARAFGVTATPSFVLVENGVIREMLLGGQSERKLESLLDA